MTDTVVLVAAAALFFVLFLRVRRLFGRHRLSVPRLVLRSLILTWLLAFLLLLPSAPLALRLLGITLGAALAIGGLLATTMERVGRDLYYRPNPYFGLVVVALLLGRLAQRLLSARNLGAIVDGTRPVPTAVSDPWSRFLILAAMTYFAVYSLGILGRSRLVGPAK